MSIMISRNNYFEFITKKGKIPKDDEYEIIPLDLSSYHLNKETAKIADSNFIEETTDKYGNYMLRGHWFSDLSWTFAKKCKFELIQIDGYSSYAYSDEQMALFTYTEGDIYLTLFTDRDKYEEEKERIIKFYKEEY